MPNCVPCIHILARVDSLVAGFKDLIYPNIDEAAIGLFWPELAVQAL